MMPSKMQMPLLPRLLMPAHTCTFTGCFGLHVKLMCNIIFRQYYVTITTCVLGFWLGCMTDFSATKSSVVFQLDSTLIRPYHVVKVVILVLNSPRQSLHLIRFPDHLAVCTSSKRPTKTCTAPTCMNRVSILILSCCTLLFTCIHQERKKDTCVCAYLKTVLNEISIPLSFSNLWSWVAVDSSSFSICWSTNSLTHRVIFNILPDPGLLTVEPVFLYTFRNFQTPTIDTCMPSSSNSNFAIVYGFSPLLWW